MTNDEHKRTSDSVAYRNRNRPQAEMTALPSKYPQGYFKPKPCRECGAKFAPRAPSHLTCSQECADRMVVSAYLRRNYQIVLSDYEAMLMKQQHTCAICGGEGFVMAAHHKLKLVVDHCHASGKVRGLLCHNCNRALGLLKDSKDNIMRALAYVGGSIQVQVGRTPRRTWEEQVSNAGDILVEMTSKA